MKHSYQSFLSELEFVKKYTLGVAMSRSNQEVYTPVGLAQDMLSKIPKDFWSSPKNCVMDPCVKSGIFLMESIEKFMHGLKSWEPSVEKRFKHIIENQIYGFCCSSWAHKMTNKSIFGDMLYNGHIYNHEFLDSNGETSIIVKKLIKNMKFDCIIGNPPYQTKVGNRKTEPLWHLFVKNSIESLQDGGYLCFVHPSGWRNVDGRFNDTKNLIVSKDVEYLETHNKSDGIKTFGATTSYDWYILKNSPSFKKTTVKFQDGFIKIIDLNAMSFIPNGSYDKIASLLAKNGEAAAEIIHSYSEYETRKPHISKQKIGNFIHPCAYIVKTDNSLELVYSNVKKVHFGTPKLIWGNGGCEMGSFLDKDGKYGLTQFCYAIVDYPKNLNNIKKAFDSKEFRNLMKCCTDSSGNINHKVLALFRKDFWKDFI